MGNDDETVESLGEFGLIDLIAARLPQGEQVVIGPGDDAAVLKTGDGRVVATTDVLAEGRHFRRAWSSPYDVGRKAAAQSLADIAAMGARPTALLVALTLPAELPAAWPLDLADGLRDECARVGASVVGGDLVRDQQITIAVAALGDLGGHDPITRGGARPGDAVAVAGRLGWSVAGLAVLQQGTVIRTAAADAVIGAHRRPQPPYDLALQAAAAGATALIDVSDGLLQDLGHVAEASAVAIDLDSAALVPDPELVEIAASVRADPASWVLTGGEDHAFAACLPGPGIPAGWRRVGRVAHGARVTVDGRVFTGAGGFDHFRTL
jgi:thiamine-monophosphate kinase